MEGKSDLKHFKNQMDSMLSALSQMNSADKSVAFSLLKKCVSTAQDQTSETSFTDLNQQIDLDPHHIKNEQESLLIDALTEEEHGIEGISVIENFEPIELEPVAQNSVESNITNSLMDLENANNVCRNCFQKFPSLDDLSLHLETYPKNPMSCRNCTKEFSNEFLFKLHVDSNPCKKFRKPIKESLIKTCTFCQRVFYNAQHYDRHVSGHKRNNCSLCSALFSNRKHLETHMLEMHDTKLEKNYFECKFCFKKFSQKRSILKHYKLHHSKQCSVCTICGKFFDSSNELDVHLLDHESKKWTCEPCKQTFIRHQQYLKHLREHDKYFCITCNLGFSSRNKIMDHSKLGHAVRGLETVHKCGVCSRVCESKDKLIRHLKSHKEKDQYSCKTCKVSFNKAVYFKQHLNSGLHADKLTMSTNNSVQSCRLCFKSFPNKNQLYIHTQEVHGISQNVTRCPFCNYKSKQKANMKRHIDLHMQQRKYVCDQCGSSFYSFSCLKEHIACVHSTDRNFSCEKCGMSFKLNSGLKRHMATHSEERTKKCHCGQSYKLSSNLKRHQLLVHGKVESNSNLQRLVKNDYGEYIPVETKKISKNNDRENKEFQFTEDQSKTVLPQDNTVPFNDCQLMQSVQVFYQNLDFPTTNDSKQSLLFTPGLDIAHLQLVETMLHAASVNDPLKQTQDILVDSSGQNIFDRPITDTDTYLATDVTLNPPIEVAQITNLDLTSHSNQLAPDGSIANAADNQQSLISSLSDYIIPHQFPFLNV